ncbi:hypothetical protein [Neogemmobacter tilapiae]|uniref:Uncharacterized protein n=1 Tax=Neogemmobacter tilapiae TaxID=875041 RepID=A0A918TIJ6_9RHOB|nr:hypothetical protein [Gemmobacter tilapiae]GHC48684.1 hypothetical protein GCM10007315_08400 [Gemmobacter tilapiae]
MTTWFAPRSLEPHLSAMMFDELVEHLRHRPDLTDVQVTDRDHMILCFRKAGMSADGPVLTLNARAMACSAERVQMPCAQRLAQIDRFLASILPQAQAALDLSQLYPVVRHRDRIVDLESPLVRPLAGDMITVVMQDLGDSLATITACELGGKSVEDLWQAAGINLRRALGQFDATPEAPGYLTIRWPDNPVLSGSILLASGILAALVRQQGWRVAGIGAAARGTIRLADSGDDEAMALMQADLAQDLAGAQPQSELIFRLSADTPWLEPWQKWTGAGFSPLPIQRRH